MTRKPITEFGGKYRFLSNFYPVAIKTDGVTYPSVEHAYQASKTTDPEDRQMFLTCTASQAKRWGSPTGRIKIRKEWDSMKAGVMKELLQKKFAEYPFRLALLSTENAHLEEGNWWGDTFWGTVDGKGENWLGKMLMEIRNDIQQEEKVLNVARNKEEVQRTVRNTIARQGYSR